MPMRMLFVVHPSPVSVVVASFERKSERYTKCSALMGGFEAEWM
jgi:hypothetical protein